MQAFDECSNPYKAATIRAMGGEQLCPLVGVRQESARGLVEMSHYLFRYKHALRENGIDGHFLLEIRIC